MPGLYTVKENKYNYTGYIIINAWILDYKIRINRIMTATYWL